MKHLTIILLISLFACEKQDTFKPETKSKAKQENQIGKQDFTPKQVTYEVRGKAGGNIYYWIGGEKYRVCGNEFRFSFVAREPQTLKLYFWTVNRGRMDLIIKVKGEIKKREIFEFEGGKSQNRKAEFKLK